MKIKSISLKKHPILGDLTLDFTDPKDPSKIVDNIVFAGENGVGKSTILDCIKDLYHLEGAQSIKHDDLEVIFVLRIDLNAEQLRSFEFPKTPDDGEITISYAKATPEEKNHKGKLRRGVPSYRQKVFATIDGVIFESLEQSISRYITKNSNMVYLPPNVSFEAGRTSSSNHLELDVGSELRDDASTTLSTVIELFAGLEVLDAVDFSRWAKKNPSLTNNEYPVEHRIDRFTNAYSLFFEGLKYEGSCNPGNGNTLTFSNAQGSFDVKSLSSGEKQIIIRMAQLLINQKLTIGGIAIIDEPETNLHPRWQEKMYEAVQTLLSTKGLQTTQIFTATLSPFVVENAIKSGDAKVIGLKKDPKTGVICCIAGTGYSDWKIKDAVKAILNLDTSLHDKEFKKMTSEIRAECERKILKAETERDVCKNIIMEIKEKRTTVNYMGDFNQVNNGGMINSKNTDSFNYTINNVNEIFTTLYKKLDTIEDSVQKRAAKEALNVIKEEIGLGENGDEGKVDKAFKLLAEKAPKFGKFVWEALKSLPGVVAKAGIEHYFKDGS